MPEEIKFFHLSHFRSVEYKPSNVTEQQILIGILHQEDKMYRFIYKHYFASVKSIVSGFHSLILDPDDIFQEGLIAASLNVEKGRFNGESSFQTYLVAICRNICLKKLNRHKRVILTDFEKLDVIDEAYCAPEDQINRMLRLKAMLDEKCREIINLRFGLSETTGVDDPVPYSVPPPEHHPLQDGDVYFSNKRFEEISSILGIEPDNARQRFKRCIGKLRALMLKDHSFKMTLTDS